MTRRKDGLYQEVLTVNGKKKYFYGKTKAEVLRKIRAYQEKEETGPLFKDVAEAWWEEHTPSLSPNTLRCYQKPYERAKEYFTNSYIKDITPKNILIWLETLEQKQFSHKTLISHKLVIGLIFHYAILNGYINSNPSEYVTVPKGKPKVPRTLPLDGDIIKIQQSVHLPMGLLHYFVLYTGCRRSEAMALKFSDIDENVVHITKSIYYDGPTPKIKQPKTAAGTRDIILLDVLKEKLPKGKPEDFVFFPEGIPPRTTFERSLRKYREESGISCTLHQIRHAYATILFEAGIDEKSAQQLMGHSSIQMTKDVYTHIRESKIKDTAQKLNDYVKNV